MNKQLIGSSDLLAGAIAGMVGTVVMMGMRSFDQRYAPRTIPKTREDPGAFIVKQTAHSAGLEGKIPKPLKTATAKMLHASYGTTAGVLYAFLRGRPRSASPLVDGGLLGAAMYTAAHAGWLPLLKLSPPIWKQSFPEIVGGLMRHVAYGVSTAAVYKGMNGQR